MVNNSSDNNELLTESDNETAGLSPLLVVQTGLSGREPEELKDITTIPEEKLRDELKSTMMNQTCKVCLSNRCTGMRLQMSHALKL